MAFRKRDESGQAIVMGGSLHTAPDGRLCTIQTLRTLVDPQTAQGLRARVTRQTYPPAWNGRTPEGALIIYWSKPIKFVCGRCTRRLGTYVAYEADTEIGVVEDTSHEYVRLDNPYLGTDPSVREISPNRPWRIDGEIAGRASHTHAHITCRKCDRTYRRNLQRLGHELWELETSTYVFER